MPGVHTTLRQSRVEMIREPRRHQQQPTFSFTPSDTPLPRMDSRPNKTNGLATSATHPNGSLHPKSSPPSLTPRLLPVQIIILAVYPVAVIMGLVSNHPQDSYFARKDNVINLYLLKFAWFWTSIAFFAHVVRVPNKVAPTVRYLAATTVWYLVTQWCFGPPIMDKVFRGTGGICQLAKDEEFPNVFTSAVCRSSGGAWSGGHDLVYIAPPV
jgi:hypothetical protein